MTQCTIPINPDTIYAPWVHVHGLRYPYGECQCGCGKTTKITNRTSRTEETLQGHPRRYLSGHNRPKLADPIHQLPHGIEYGHCHCGCGQKTKIALATNRRAGQIKGEPLRFIPGHAVKIHGYRQSYPALEAAFWQHVQKGAHESCWEWKGYRMPRMSHGQLRYKNKGYLAHRVSWEIHHGPIPKGLNVLHKCDNPPCCNPAHLFLGTQNDNVQDMIEKERNSRGETHSKYFTDDDAMRIRQLAADGVSIRELATRYNTHYENVRMIVRRKTFKHLP